jgi:peptide/nickel transport system ATP-binding protein
VRWIPQEPARAFTVTNHLLPQMLEGVTDRDAVRPQLERLLKALGLPTAEELDHRYPFEMSGGMLQRAAVISAFLTNPDLVVADEPTAYLDPPRTLLLARIVSALARSTKASVLWVTHDLRLAAAVADRLVLLSDGQIEAEGDPATLLNPFGENPSPLVTASARMALPV